MARHVKSPFSDAGISARRAQAGAGRAMNASQSGRTRVLRPPFSPKEREVLGQALAAGRTMTYPTETSYALGGSALDAELVERVFRLKARAPDKALLLLVDGSRGLAGLAGEVVPAASRLMEACWPGPLTLVVPAAPTLPAHLRDARGTVALRWSAHPVVQELLQIGRGPLIGTSANLSGRPEARRLEEVLATFGDAVELAVDGGATPEGPLSTLLDTTTTPFKVLRAGALPSERLRAVLQGAFAEWAPAG